MAFQRVSLLSSNVNSGNGFSELQSGDWVTLQGIYVVIAAPKRLQSGKHGANPKVFFWVNRRRPYNTSSWRGSDLHSIATGGGYE